MAFDINNGFSPDDTWYGDYLKLKSKVDNGELVEVVRCKDCIHQYKDEKLNGLYCALMTTVNIKIIADNDEYCSAGERRDEE